MCKVGVATVAVPGLAGCASELIHPPVILDDPNIPVSDIDDPTPAQPDSASGIPFKSWASLPPFESRTGIPILNLMFVEAPSSTGILVLKPIPEDNAAVRYGQNGMVRIRLTVAGIETVPVVNPELSVENQYLQEVAADLTGTPASTYDVVFVIGQDNSGFYPDGTYRGGEIKGCATFQEIVEFLRPITSSEGRLYLSVTQAAFLQKDDAHRAVQFYRPESSGESLLAACESSPLAYRLYDFHTKLNAADPAERVKLVQKLDPRQFTAIAAYAYQIGHPEISGTFNELGALWEQALEIAEEKRKHRMAFTKGGVKGNSYKIASRVFKELLENSVGSNYS